MDADAGILLALRHCDLIGPECGLVLDISQMPGEPNEHIFFNPSLSAVSLQIGITCNVFLTTPYAWVPALEIRFNWSKYSQELRHFLIAPKWL